MQQRNLVVEKEVKEVEKFKEVPPIVTVNGQELEFVNQTRIGPFTWVHLIKRLDVGKGSESEGITFHGFGGSKQSPSDKFNFQHGLLIALGRAEKSIRLKENKKPIQHPYMA